ncbi:MAG: hypothetical protein Greene07147_212 [Parcubacteria group bacterium Greene0714_7]|nr:MAG: hypothetical protein Greene07147_212 [Parcubacteria group bacterium Greene0714_7]
MFYMHIKTPEVRHLFPVHEYHHGAVFKERGVLMRYCAFCKIKMADVLWREHLKEMKH